MLKIASEFTTGELASIQTALDDYIILYKERLEKERLRIESGEERQKQYDRMVKFLERAKTAYEKVTGDNITY